MHCILKLSKRTPPMRKQKKWVRFMGHCRYTL